MALDNFKPQLWAARAAYHLDRAMVYASPDVVNRDYEGEIRAAGNSVKINQVGDVTVRDYVVGTAIESPEALNSAQTILVIDKQKYVNFSIDDVDKAQINMNVMDKAMERASYGFAASIDTDMATVITDAVPSANTEGTTGSPVSITTADLAFEYLTKLMAKLDDNNVPEAGRYVVVPPWYYALLLRNTAFVAAGTPVTDSRLITGVISQALGIKILKSSAVPNTTGTKYKIVAGSNIATSVAAQIPAESMEAYRPHTAFSDAVKGLFLYGRKVTHPNALAMLIANKT